MLAPFLLQEGLAPIVDGNGTPVVKYAYDAWGKILSITGSMASSLGKLNPFRYRGYVYDDETGLYYLRTRYYNPQWGRFISADSLITGNLFEYCHNNPVLYEDPDGYAAKITLSSSTKEKHSFVTEVGGGGGGSSGASITGAAPAATHSPNPWGRHGSPAHRDKVKEVAADATEQFPNYRVEKDHFRVEIKNGFKASRIPDVAIVDHSNNIVHAYQIGIATKGGLPVGREIEALIDLLLNGIPTEFIPYKSR